jgi:hypothetical protein
MTLNGAAYMTVISHFEAVRVYPYGRLARASIT